MKHPSNRELFDYWNKRRGDRLAPERADIEPAAIRQVLGDTFVLERERHRNHLFRLAGTRLCALFGRELKGESFVKLWQRSGQTAIRELIAVVHGGKGRRGCQRDRARPPTTRCRRSIWKCCCCRCLLVSAARRACSGALAPMAAPYWLGAKAIGPLTLGMFRHIGAGARTRRRAALQRRRPAGSGMASRSMTAAGPSSAISACVIRRSMRLTRPLTERE